jgi:integrase
MSQGIAYSLRHRPLSRTRWPASPAGWQLHIPCDTIVAVADVLPMPHPSPSLQEAVDAFLAQPDLAPTSRRSYAQTTGRLLRAFGSAQLLGELVPAAVASAVEETLAGSSPRTWNRHLAALGSFVAFCRRRVWPVQDLVAGLDRWREKADNSRVLTFLELDRLWSRESVGLRERCLWRLLYETAARAGELLSLNVEDVDLANKRAVVISKGGDRELLHFQTGSARLLPRLIGGRSRGPLFLADRPPVASRAPARADLCPETGRARLSYRRAEELFVAATRGRTLHDLRRAALTHLGEDNVSLPLLMAKSRHRNLRSLQRYVRPSPEAVASLTAQHDPAGRRRG